MKTIDGTFPNILAMTGGLGKETAELLKNRGLYGRFREIVEGELKEGFGSGNLKELSGLPFLQSVSQRRISRIMKMQKRFREMI